MQKIYRVNVVSWKTLAIAGLLLSLVFLTGCTTQSSSGQSISPGMTNGAIIKDPAAYEGRDLVLKGKIATECGSGLLVPA